MGILLGQKPTKSVTSGGGRCVGFVKKALPNQVKNLLSEVKLATGQEISLRMPGSCLNYSGNQKGLEAVRSAMVKLRRKFLPEDAEITFNG
ncbi:MAG: hypothetical protein WCX27_02015 [Candidatus Paceibacterota bacterium]|jgi:hypothetical protein